MTNSRHEQWLQQLLNGDTITAASSRLDIAKSTLGKQLRAGGLPAEMVIRLCRAYSHPPVAGLVETGYLEPNETNGHVQVQHLDDVSTRALIDELWIRTDEGKKELEGDADTDNDGKGDKVVHLHTSQEALNNADLTNEPMAADSSPDEPGPGEDGYHDGP